MPAEPAITSLSATTTAYLQLPGGWFLNNAGWITGTDRTLLVDTCATESRSRHLVESARAARPDVPISAVLTHAHGDHTNGAGLVARSGDTVLTSQNAKGDVLSGPHTHPELFDCSTWGDITPPSTTETVGETTRLELGGAVTEVIPVPTHAHTDGDLVVWQPEDRVLFTGDLVFNGVTPLALHGCLTGWLDALNWLDTFPAEHLVPGHGPVVGPTDSAVNDVRRYLHWLLDAVSDTHDPDFTELERHAHQRWGTWHDAERHAANLRVAHAEIHGHDVPLVDAAAASSAPPAAASPSTSEPTAGSTSYSDRHRTASPRKDPHSHGGRSVNDRTAPGGRAAPIGFGQCELLEGPGRGADVGRGQARVRRAGRAGRGRPRAAGRRLQPPRPHRR